MADEESTSVAEVEDTSVDTSVTSDDSTTDNDVDLEDMEVSLSDIDSNTDPEEAETEDDSSEDTEEVAAEDEPGEEEAESSDTEETEPSDEEARKQAAKEQYERRQQEKQQRMASQAEEQQQYLDEAEDNRDLALRQLQVDAYNNRIERNSNSLTNGYERALKDFDVLRDQNPVIQRQLNKAIDAFQAQHVTIDGYGNPTEVKGDFYQYLQQEADSIAELTGIGARQQEKSKGRERAKTLATPNRAPRQAKSDPDLEAFDEEAWK